jgi:hypothetical protein
MFFNSSGITALLAKFKPPLYKLFCADYENTRGNPMLTTLEIPKEVAKFKLPHAVQERLQYLLDKQDAGEELTTAEREEATGLVEVAEFLSLLKSA